MSTGEVNHTCCPPTCGCCPKLGVPEYLEVTIENVANQRVDVSPPGPDPCVTGCHHCELINGTWYPEISEYIGGGDTAQYWNTCWYHLSLDVDLDCDGGWNSPGDPWPDTPSWPRCVENPPVTIDLWVKIVCDHFERSQTIEAEIYQDAPDEPVIDAPEGPDGLEWCVNLTTFGSIKTAESEDPCVILNEICDWLIDGVELTTNLVSPSDYSPCTQESSVSFDENCVGYAEEGYIGHWGDSDYNIKITVKRPFKAIP